jgi:hypothetical protein
MADHSFLLGWANVAHSLKVRPLGAKEVARPERTNSCTDPIGWQLDDEVPCGALDACEERSVMAETGVAHHRAPSDAGLFHEIVGEAPEKRFAPLRRSAISLAGCHAASPPALYARRYPVAASQRFRCARAPLSSTSRD